MLEASIQGYLEELARSTHLTPGRLAMGRNFSTLASNTIQSGTNRFYKSWPGLCSGMGYFQSRSMRKRGRSQQGTGFPGLGLLSLPFYSTRVTFHNTINLP